MRLCAGMVFAAFSVTRLVPGKDDFARSILPLSKPVSIDDGKSASRS
jgi:hypothetical protein